MPRLGTKPSTLGVEALRQKLITAEGLRLTTEQKHDLLITSFPGWGSFQRSKPELEMDVRHSP